MIKAAIFDWDGTLVDTFPIALRAFRQAVTSKLSEEDFKKAVSIAFGVGVKGVVREIMAWEGRKVSEGEVEEMARGKMRAQVEMTEETELLPGAIELLNMLRDNGVRMAVCSSNHAEVIRPVLEFHGLTDYFETVIVADNTKAKKLKPDPGIFLDTAERMGLSPNECCVFEDSVPGIEAAKRAGMLVIAVGTGPFERKDLLKAKPDMLIENLEDVNRIGDFLGL